MVSTLETDMSSVVILYMILIQGVLGTFFPPVSNPPPIPGQSVRNLENPRQGFFVQGNLPQEFSTTLVKEGLFSSEEKVGDQRWYLQEKQSDESGQDSPENFDRFYQSGEPAIGPVATPIPDDAYLSQPSSISKLGPNEPANSDIWILSRRPYNQYIPDRWVQLQLPPERFVEIVNQDPGPLATDPLKSIIAPVSSEVPVRAQFTANTLANIIQQVWVRSPNALSPQLTGKSSDIIEEVPSIKQIVDIPTANVKQVVQQQVIKDDSDAALPLPEPSTPTLVSKKPFIPPPPPPPPIKGYDQTSKNGPPAPVNIIPDSNVLVSDNNGLFQRVRHIWVPTSSRTGKFITFPVPTSFNPGKSIGLPLARTPITVSDTWVLKQGPIPSFEQRPSLVPPPEIQSGKVIFQDPPLINADAPPIPSIVAQVDPPKDTIIENSVDSKPPVDIWPARTDIPGSKNLGKVPVDILPDTFPASPISDEIAITKSLIPPKILSNPRYLIRPSGLPPPTKLINGKPCPIPIPPHLLQKYFLSPRSQTLIATPRLLTNQKRPVARIVRVNRYPSGSYYLLNNRIRPSLLTYPNVPLVPSKIVRLVQGNQITLPFQSKPPTLPTLTKQIPMPQLPKQFPAPVPAKQVLSPFGAKQIVTSVPSPKSSRFIYPGLQAMKYSYPWNPKNSPVPGKGVYLSQLSPQKTTLPPSNSGSSSESSSESSSSDSEVKKDKLKEDKPKKEGKEASEKELENSAEESKETISEVDSGVESIEAAESQALSEVTQPHTVPLPHEDQNNAAPHQENSDIDGGVTTPQHHNHVSDAEALINEPSTNAHDLNSMSNHVTNSDEKAGVEGSTEDMTTALVRD